MGAGGVGAGGRVAGKGMVCGRPVDVRVAVRRVAIENHEANAAQDPLSSIAGTVMEFMNSQHKGDLVQYIVQMGSGKVVSVWPQNGSGCRMESRLEVVDRSTDTLRCSRKIPRG